MVESRPQAGGGAPAIAPGPARLDPEGVPVLVIGRHSQGWIVVEDVTGQIGLIRPDRLTALDRRALC